MAVLDFILLSFPAPTSIVSLGQYIIFFYMVSKERCRDICFCENICFAPCELQKKKVLQNQLWCGWLQSLLSNRLSIQWQIKASLWLSCYLLLHTTIFTNYFTSIHFYIIALTVLYNKWQLQGPQLYNSELLIQGAATSRELLPREELA